MDRKLRTYVRKRIIELFHLFFEELTTSSQTKTNRSINLLLFLELDSINFNNFSLTDEILMKQLISKEHDYFQGILCEYWLRGFSHFRWGKTRNDNEFYRKAMYELQACKFFMKFDWPRSLLEHFEEEIPPFFHVFTKRIKREIDRSDERLVLKDLFLENVCLEAILDFFDNSEKLYKKYSQIYIDLIKKIPLDWLLKINRLNSFVYKILTRITSRFNELIAIKGLKDLMDNLRDKLINDFNRSRLEHVGWLIFSLVKIPKEIEEIMINTLLDLEIPRFRKYDAIISLLMLSVEILKKNRDLLPIDIELSFELVNNVNIIQAIDEFSEKIYEDFKDNRIKLKESDELIDPCKYDYYLLDEDDFAENSYNLKINVIGLSKYSKVPIFIFILNTELTEDQINIIKILKKRLNITIWITYREELRKIIKSESKYGYYIILNDIYKYIVGLFARPGNSKSETRIFKYESGKHSQIIEYIKQKINDYFFTEIHNFREEAGIDLLLKNLFNNWKIGIQVESTSDIREIKLDERKKSYVQSILAKITDSKQIKELDLFVILFCIDCTVKSYDDTIKITISRLEKLEDKSFFYIPPEHLISFFKDLDGG